MDELYPATPPGIPADLTLPSTRYRRRAWLAGSVLALFMLLYFALAGWFSWTAWRLFHTGMSSNQDAVVDILVGTTAGFLAVFMLKALFFIKRSSPPDVVEITAAQEPRLFAFLHRLADEVGAPRPRKVVLSARVNASVFYDISLINLLLPLRKNLEIGLPLVNVLTLSELKAVLAHEFGHFAQRSMAIGAWVYIAQQVAGQLIARRDALDRFIQQLSRIDLRIAWAGWLLSLIVWSIRSLLDTLFRAVVLAQRALAREMEFQADLVAVSVTGSDELVHALHKLQAADQAWDSTLEFANSQLRHGHAIPDLFEIQGRTIEKLTEIFDRQDFCQPPRAGRIPPAQHRVFKAGFARAPNMWATHPANADREENAKQRYLPGQHDARSCWLLFRNPEKLRQQLTTRTYKDTKSTTLATDEGRKAFEQHYDCLRYQARYRGCFLNRSVVRHAACVDGLLEPVSADTALEPALAGLYPDTLREELRRLSRLEGELVALEGLRERGFDPGGEGFVFRGRDLERRSLPSAIHTVTREKKAVQERVLAHDRRCRSLHLAAASRLGGGWKANLEGLIHLLHYTEHTRADLLDALGLLRNTVAVVTATGKVSKDKLTRLLGVANDLHAALKKAYADAALVRPDSKLLERLGTAAWQGTPGAFQLLPASQANINDWLQKVDGYVFGLCQQLDRLGTAALEQLLQSEADVGSSLRDGSPLEPAPAPSQLPLAYATLVPGQERKRQTQLDLWARFLRAEGAVPATARLLVAGAIVAGVLGFGGMAGLTSTISIYNGLDIPVQVTVAGESRTVNGGSSTSLDAELGDAATISAENLQGEQIERFSPPLSGGDQHYIYNVAAASPLVRWTATYGNATGSPPSYLGNPRWSTITAGVYFRQPPTSISSKTGGGIVTVLSGMDDSFPPQKVLAQLQNDEQRQEVASARARWDSEQSPNHAEWQSLAAAQSP